MVGKVALSDFVSAQDCRNLFHCRLGLFFFFFKSFQVEIYMTYGVASSMLNYVSLRASTNVPGGLVPLNESRQILRYKHILKSIPVRPPPFIVRCRQNACCTSEM